MIINISLLLRMLIILFSRKYNKPFKIIFPLYYSVFLLIIINRRKFLFLKRLMFAIFFIINSLHYRCINKFISIFITTCNNCNVTNLSFFIKLSLFVSEFINNIWKNVFLSKPNTFKILFYFKCFPI